MLIVFHVLLMNIHLSPQIHIFPNTNGLSTQNLLYPSCPPLSRRCSQGLRSPRRRFQATGRTWGKCHLADDWALDVSSCSALTLSLSSSPSCFLHTPSSGPLRPVFFDTEADVERHQGLRLHRPPRAAAPWSKGRVVEGWPTLEHGLP